MAKNKKKKRPEGIYTSPESQGGAFGKRTAAALLGSQAVIPGGRRIGGRNAYMGVTGYQAARAALRSKDPQEQKMGRQILGSMAVGGAAGALLSRNRKEGAKWGGTIGAMVGGRVAKKKYNRSLEEYAMGLIAFGEEIMTMGFADNKTMYGGDKSGKARLKRMAGISGAPLIGRVQAEKAAKRSLAPRERAAAKEVIKGGNRGALIGATIGGVAGGVLGSRLGLGRAGTAAGAFSGANIGGLAGLGIGQGHAGERTGFAQKKLKNWEKK